MPRKLDAESCMKAGVREAVKIARNCGITLDFTDRSIKDVDRLLGELHREYKKTKSEEGLRGFALMFAAYIGEVIRKKGLPGKWSRDHETLGEEIFPLQCGEHTFLPYIWCQKRIFDGPGDDVAFKYKALVLAELKAPKSPAPAKAKRKR
jgi:hypothetical protein